jgi:hypothetical protein
MPVMATFAAPGASQDMYVDCPLRIVACPILMPGSALGLTVTVVVLDTWSPDLPFADMVYVVVPVGVTDVEPDAPTVPMFGEIVTLTAFDVVQCRTAVSPMPMEALSELNELITGGYTGAGVNTGISGG